MNKSPRLNSALAIAKVRGFETLTTKQMEQLNTLLMIQEITVTEALNEVLDAPKRRISRSAKSARAELANGLTYLANCIRPNN